MPRPQAPQLQRHLSEGNEVDAPRVGHWKPTKHRKIDENDEDHVEAADSTNS